jgi:hypothetical protein
MVRPMKQSGIDSLTPAEVAAELRRGGRFVFFEYCISLLFVTLRRPSAVVLLHQGERGLARGLPYTALSLLLGWWGLPWGLIYTPLAVFTNFRGGRDVTAEVQAFLQGGR